MENKNNLLKGPNVYRDEMGRAIYFIKKTNTSYVIKDEAKFNYLELRYVLAVILFIFLYIGFNLSIYISLPPAIIALVYMHYYRNKYLENCSQIKSLNPKYVPTITSKKYKSNAYLKIVLMLLLSITLMLNAFISENIKNDIMYKYVNIALSIICFIVSIKLVFDLFKGDKNV